MGSATMINPTSDASSGWQRPQGWPDLDAYVATLPSNWEGILHTVVNQDGNTSTFGLRFWGAGTKVEVGHLENNSFVVESEQTAASYELITITVSGTKLIRMIPIGSGSRGVNDSFDEFACVKESYVVGCECIKPAQQTQHVKFIRCNFKTLNKAFGNAASLEYVDFAECSNSADINLSFPFSSGGNKVKRLDLSFVNATPTASAAQLLTAATSLEYLDVRNIDFSQTANADFNWAAAINLREVYCSIPASYNPNLVKCVLLTRESLLYIINHLATATEAHTLTLGVINQSKLTAAELQIATDKGWTIA